MSRLRRQYALAWASYRTHLRRPFLWAMALFLLLSAACGVLLGTSPAGERLFRFFARTVEESGLVSASGSIRPAALFCNNLRAAGIGLLAGMVPFVFLPALVLAVNAAVIGAVLGVSAAGGADVCALIVRGILPHGIFELPAVVLSCTMGLCLCRAVNAQLRRRPGAPRIEDTLAQLARVFAAFCVPALALAALIEAYLTPLLLAL